MPKAVSVADSTISANATKMYSLHGQRFDEHVSLGKTIDNRFIELPAILKLVKSAKPKGKKLLDLGCGGGWHAREYVKLGARVTGIDLSDSLLEIAQKRVPNASFRKMDMLKLSFPRNSFDIVTSSLAMHYKDWDGWMEQVSRVLKKDGQFFFSHTNPYDDGRRRFFFHGKKFSVWGRVKDVKTGKAQVIGDYFSNPVLESDWGKGFKVRWYHATLEQIVSAITKNGFRIEQILEPKPLAKAKKLDPKRYAFTSKHPVILVFKLKNEK
ncbi:MAG: class I SAM-dependent methyltransferase [Candidatus Diapherotrites archaeon]